MSHLYSKINCLTKFVEYCIIMVLLIAPFLNGKEVKSEMELITAFLISVVASVVSYYICKWLDKHDQ